MQEFSRLLMDSLRSHRTNRGKPLSENTVMNYLTDVKKALIRNGRIMNPNFNKTILSETMRSTGDMESEMSTSEIKLVVKFQQLEPYEQYRHWKELKIHHETVYTIAGIFDRVVWSTPFFTVDYQLNSREMSVEKFSQGAVKRIKTQASIRLEEKLAKNTIIKDAQALVEFILSGLYSPDNVGDMICALALASGRRHCSFYINWKNFKRGADANQPLCYYTETVKKRGPKHTRTICIPLLCPWWLFKSCGNRLARRIELRYCRKFRDAQECNSKRSAIDNAHLKERIGDEWKMKDLRELYVAVTLKLHAEKRQHNTFVKAVLGHENIHESLHYTSLIIDPECKITQPVFPSDTTPDAKLVQAAPFKEMEIPLLAKIQEDPPNDGTLTKMDIPLLEEAPSRALTTGEETQPDVPELLFEGATEKRRPLAEQSSFCLI